MPPEPFTPTPIIHQMLSSIDRLSSNSLSGEVECR